MKHYDVTTFICVSALVSMALLTAVYGAHYILYGLALVAFLLAMVSLRHPAFEEEVTLS